ncbi:MAG: exodeoxyribonuclease VII large subunit [bacterium]|nr:exodeoxyribonuclease VII large subunit [bacterium]
MNLDIKDSELVLTVSQFLDSVNYVLTTGRPFVVGEVSEFKLTDKWVSFTLQDKEEKAILKCVMGIWDFRRIGLEIEDGMEVKVGGSPRITKSYGSFALWITSVEPVGEGSLKKAYQLLLKKLELEGLFTRKRELPDFIQHVGVISSRDGVVVHDFMNNLKPFGIKVNFLNARVEGKDAVEQISWAIKFFNKKMPELDAVVIIRGGGSLESMQAFNNEILCREIFASKIPVVAGIGHDVDVPIACLVADVSVSTPTAAANLINSSWDRLLFGLPAVADRIVGYMNSIFVNFEALSERIIGDGLRSISLSIERKADIINRVERIIKIADPERSLRLGYSLTTDSRGKIIRDIKNIKKGDIIKTLLANGSIESIIDKIK